MRKMLLLCVFLLATVTFLFAGEGSTSATGLPAKGETVQSPVLSSSTDYDLAKAVYERKMQGAMLTPDEENLVAKFFPPRDGEGGSLDATAGPDSGYYYYVDNQGTDSVVYNWIELKGDPGATWVPTTGWTSSMDDGYTTTPIALGLNFPFYGGSYSTARLGTNGNIQFTSTVSGGYGTCLPASSFGTNPTIFPFLQDQDLRRGRGLGDVTGANVVGYKNFGDYTVIQWDSTGRYGTGTLCSFNYEAILWSSGLIKFQYRRLYYDGASTSYDSAATVGIQKRNTVGYKLQYVCNKVGNPMGGVGLNEIVNRAVVFYQQLPQIAELGVSNLFPCGNQGLDLPPQTVSFRISNAGAVASSPVTAYFTFDNGVVTDAVTVPSIASNSFYDVFFTNPVTLTPGAHTLSGWFLPHDVPATNDSTACTINVARLCNSCVPADLNLDPFPQTPWTQVAGNCGNAGKWVGQFTAIAGGTYHFDLCPVLPGIDSANFDIDIKILNAACSILTGQDGSCSATGQSYRPNDFTWTAPAAGTYYVTLAPYSSYGSHTCTGTVNNTFLLGYYMVPPINCAEYPPCGTPSEVEPNDSCYWASNFINVACGEPGAPNYYFGTICPASDVDYYQLPAMSLGQILRVKLYDGPNCDTYPPTGLVMKGATGVGGICAPATGASTNSYVLGTNCLPFAGGYIGVAKNTGAENKYKIEVSCSTAVLPACPDVQLPNQFSAGPCVGPIVDNSTVEYPITVGLDATIDDLNIRLNAQHTYTGDVDIVLITPQGDSLALTRNHGGGGDNWMVTLFDDQATTTIAAGTPPYNGSYIPDNPLALVNGRSTVGTWTLRFRDEVGGDAGYVNCWSLEFTAHSCVADPMITIEPNIPQFPNPQDVTVCAHVVAGTLTQIVVPVHNESNVPTVSVASGCESDPNCVPLTAWTMSDWTYQAEPPAYLATITAADGATGCCLTLHLDYILPVEMRSFEALAGDNSVKLSWVTASESGIDHFDIMRDGAAVARVAGNNRTTGDNYSWTDATVQNGTIYHYNLFAVGVNGARQQLGSVAATPSFDAAVITEYALHQNYPNPFNPTTSIAVDLVERGFVSLKIYNLMGQQVASLVNGNMDAGRHVVHFDAAGLSSGIYLYRLNVNGFAAEKKMLLMK